MSAIRIVVTHGGSLPDEELAALTLALTGGRPDRGDDRVAAWSRAVLLEGTGGRTPASPADLDLLPGG